jgi:hypothetical protein
MLAASLAIFAGCAEKSTEEKPAISGTDADAGEAFSGEPTVNESCVEEYVKFTACPADEMEMEPKIDSKGEPPQK